MIKKTNLRLKNKVAIVVGGGQRTGETIGNGRAVSMTYAKQGAKVVVVDNNLDAAQETVHKIKENGGIGFAYQADVVVETEIAALINYVRLNFGQIDILHNNLDKVFWDTLSINPAIFEIDYAKLKTRIHCFKEELM